MEHLTVSQEEAFDLAGAWNTASDNYAHPPLYFVVLMLVTSLFFQNDFTKWSGLTTNLPFFVLNLVLVYLTAKRLFHRRALPSFAVLLLYGISVGAVNTAVYMRMYMMLTFLVSLYFYAHCLLFERIFTEDAGIRRCFVPCALIFLAILGGALTQYYFLILAFLFSLLFGVCLLLKKQRMLSLVYGGCSIVPVMLSILVSPNYIEDLFFNQRGAEALDNAASASGWQTSFLEYRTITDGVLFGFHGWCLAAALLLLLAAVILRRTCVFRLLPGAHPGSFTVQIRRRQPDIPPEAPGAFSFGVVWSAVFVFLLFLAVLCFTGVIALIAPFKEDRYVMCIFPAIFLIVCYCMDSLLKRAACGKPVLLAAGFVLAGIVLSGYGSPGVSYLYQGANEQMHYLDPFPEARAIVITDDGDDWSSSCIAHYLMRSGSVLPTTEKDLPQLSAMAAPEPSEQMLLYIYTAKEPAEEWTDAYLDQVEDALHPTSVFPLFRTNSYECFNVYVLNF